MSPPRAHRTTSETVLGIPFATIIILIIAVVGAIDLLIDGTLSHDFQSYALYVGGPTGLLAIGRGLDQHAKP